jgi:hypothetical protein
VSARAYPLQPLFLLTPHLSSILTCAQR